MAAWTKEATEKLIRLYKSQPCLYNSHLREYRDQPLKKRTWESIKNNLQDVRRNVTAEQVKSKISSMRGQLSAEYAKLRYNQNYEPKLWFFNQLDFLKEFTRNASQERNTPTPSRMNESFDESSRDSIPSRNSIASPASFYEAQSINRSSPITARMRPGVSSPAGSLYGEEAEPFIAGAAGQLPEIASKSFELAAIADDIPTNSKFTTATSFDSYIFDQKTASFILPHISPSSISPLNGRGDQPANENFSAFRMPMTSTPLSREASAENAVNNSTESSNIFSPPRRVIVNNEDVKNSYEIIVVSDNELSLAEPRPVKTELAYEMYTQTEEEPKISSSEIETQTELIPQLVPKQLVEKSVQTDGDLPQPALNDVAEASNRTENLSDKDNDDHQYVNANQNQDETQPGTSSSEITEPKSEVRGIFIQTDGNFIQKQDEPQPSTSGKETTRENFNDHARNFLPEKKDQNQDETETLGMERKSEVCEISKQTDENVIQTQNEAQPSTLDTGTAQENFTDQTRKFLPEKEIEKNDHHQDETDPEISNTEPKSEVGGVFEQPKENLIQNQDEAQPSTSGTRENFNNHKRKFSPEKKEIPTEDSDSEYFSAEERSPQASPAPKRPKIRQVTSATILPNYFMPIRETDEADLFGNLVAMKLKPLPPEERNVIETKILSAFTAPKKKVLNFWPF